MRRLGTLGNFPEHYVFTDLFLRYKGFFKMLAARIEGVPHLNEFMHRGESSFVLPVDFKRRVVYLIRAPRLLRGLAFIPEGKAFVLDAIANGESSQGLSVHQDKILVWEVAAGMIDGDETPEVAAARELEEECGIVYPPEKLTKVATISPSIGGLTETLHLYIASIDEAFEDLAPQGDGNETMEVWEVSFDEVMDLFDAGKFQGAGAYILLQHLKLLIKEEKNGQRQ